MTDLERLTALLDDFGVTYETTHTPVAKRYQGGPNPHEGKPATMITVQNGSCDKVDGYVSFFTDFVFLESTGEFVCMGAWE